MKTKPGLFKCPECKLYYYDEKTAEACAVFCKAHNACSFELIQKSVEHQKAMRKRR